MRRDRARPPGQAQCRPVQPAPSPRHLFSHPPSCCFWHCLCFAAAAGFVLLPLLLPPLLLLLVAAFMRSPSAFSRAPASPVFTVIKFLSHAPTQSIRSAHASLPCLRIRCIYFGSPSLATFSSSAPSAAVPPFICTPYKPTHTHTHIFVCVYIFIYIFVACTFSAGVALSIFYF